MYLQVKNGKYDPMLIFNFRDQEELDRIVKKLKGCNDRFRNEFSKYEELRENVTDNCNTFERYINLLENRADSKYAKEDVDLSSMLFKSEFPDFFNLLIWLNLPYIDV